MEVVPLTRDSEELWERFLEASPQATLGHLLGWRNVVQQTYHHTPYYLMAVDGHAVKGVLPLVLIRSPLFGRLLVTAPYLSYGGLIELDDSAGEALVEQARQIARENKAKYIELRGLQKVGRGLLLKEKYCTFLLSLEVGPDVLWKRFEGGRVRTAVRKALKSGLIVERGLHLQGVFADIMSRHMRDLGTPFHPLRFYQSIAKEFPHQSEILMARHGDRYVGGIFVISFQDTVYWYCGAGLHEYKSLAPISLLVWDAIRSSCERGFAHFDFGRSRWDSGTSFFKRQWRAQPIPLYYEYHLMSGGNLPDMDPMNPSFSWAITFWKRLPIFAAKALGPLIIRDIP
jgi:FemAB-related protein (PEP-CTERM system-associated)